MSYKTIEIRCHDGRESYTAVVSIRDEETFEKLKSEGLLRVSDNGEGQIREILKMAKGGIEFVQRVNARGQLKDGPRGEPAHISYDEKGIILTSANCGQEEPVVTRQPARAKKVKAAPPSERAMFVSKFLTMQAVEDVLRRIEDAEATRKKIMGALMTASAMEAFNGMSALGASWMVAQVEGKPDEVYVSAGLAVKKPGNDEAFSVGSVWADSLDMGVLSIKKALLDAASKKGAVVVVEKTTSGSVEEFTYDPQGKQFVPHRATRQGA